VRLSGKLTGPFLSSQSKVKSKRKSKPSQRDSQSQVKPSQFKLFAQTHTTSFLGLAKSSQAFDSVSHKHTSSSSLLPSQVKPFIQYHTNTLLLPQSCLVKTSQSQIKSKSIHVKSKSKSNQAKSSQVKSSQAFHSVSHKHTQLLPQSCLLLPRSV
jgi:hypothetical protein